MTPNAFVPFALAAYAVVTLVCMAMMPPRRAVTVMLVGGWLLLPHFDDHYRFLLFFNTKATYISTVILVASLLLDGGRWMRLRPRLLDLPVAVLCVEAYFTATSNGFEGREGLRASLDIGMGWLAPYLLGRVYFGSLKPMRSFALALVGGALAYVLPSLWEIRMSPQLHQALYGYRPFGFDQVIRFGGWRPSVFMQHGLALGLFMAIGALGAYWLWRTERRARVAGLPMGWVAAGLVVMTLLCKSTGAILLMAAGIGLLEALKRLRSPALLVVVTLLPPVFSGARIAGWNAADVVGLVRSTLSDERADSLQFRLENENLLVRKAMLRPWLGWGRFGRSFVYSEEGDLLTVTDSLWVIIVGTSGLLGLATMWAFLLLPVLALARKFPVRTWVHPRLAPAVVLALGLLMWATDDLFNAMFTPLYPAMAGALVSLVALPLRALAPRRRPAPAVGYPGPPGPPPSLRRGGQP